MQQLVAGDTLKFLTRTPDYPASAGWVLTYRLIPRVSGTALSFNAGADGDDHQVEVSASTTADWATGEYSWAAYVTKDGERYTVDGWASVDGQYNGGSTLTIKPNPATINAYDNRSTARKVLDGLLALHEAHADGQGLVAEYSIAGRSMRFRDVADLQSQIRFWRGEVEREDRAQRVAAGRDAGTTLRVRL